MTGCGCLLVVAAIVGMLAIFIRGSFDSGEPIEQAVALTMFVLLAELWQWERSAEQLVRARRA